MSGQSGFARKHVKGRRSGKRQPSVFAPAEPDVVFGWFKDRKLSDLTDGELNDFLLRDARSQTREVIVPISLWPLKTVKWQAVDLSQYWFAKYELERRKPKARSEDVSFDIRAADSQRAIARRLFDYGFKAAAIRYHPDHAGINSNR